jgi:hypothetical protein
MCHDPPSLLEGAMSRLAVPLQVRLRTNVGFPVAGCRHPDIDSEFAMSSSKAPGRLLWR